MSIDDLVRQITDFSEWNHSNKILLFGWYLHVYEAKTRFEYSDVRNCYLELAIEPPNGLSGYMQSLESSKPKRILRDRTGFYLERRVREDHDLKYGAKASTIAVDSLLTSLPKKIQNAEESIYLSEALICFRNKAFRAAIIMTWNLAYDHFCTLVFSKHLTAFNAQLPKSFPKSRIIAISTPDDFSELKEAEVLQVARSANILNQNLFKIFKEKLDRRNIAAHPSSITIAAVTAEEFILDIIENAVLKFV